MSESLGLAATESFAGTLDVGPDAAAIEYVRGIGEVEYRIAALAEIEKRVIETIKHKFSRQRETLEKERAFIEQSFGVEARAATTEAIKRLGKKTVDWGLGSTGFRKSADKFIWGEDEAALVVWAKQHCPAAIRVVESVHKSVLGKHIKETGELPPGVELEPGGDVFFVKPDLEVVRHMLESQASGKMLE